jgi:hypothetical protein
MNAYSHLPSDLRRSLESLDRTTAWVDSLDPSTMKTSALLRAYAVLSSSEPSPSTEALRVAWREKSQACEAEIDKRFPIPVANEQTT